ncbi:MAG: carboxymuconolactone decarboxylase family protein [Alphaproteobacteria bacterium]
MTMLNKELVAVAISVAAGCRPCTTYHLAKVREAGASEEAIENVVTSAIYVRTSATEGMHRHALGLEPEQKGCGCASPQPVEELIALGASLAVNCAENVARHLAAAKALNVPQEELDEVFALVKFIRAQAVKHAEMQFGTTAPTTMENCCC